MDYRITFADGSIVDAYSCDNVIEAINQAVESVKSDQSYSDVVLVERL